MKYKNKKIPEVNLFLIKLIFQNYSNDLNM